ncbi:MAG TPA: glycosyltransferase family 2 protein [Patescibacteria group bacterium]|nr:glycosyltransferase family 2 protein [Patescibacteria group bacterium]
MNSTPLVSIIVPTYNRKKMAANLIRSILQSSYKKIELIIIDDASNDGTKDYLENKFKKNKIIKIYRNKKNLFAAGSKNVGEEKAKGKYIAFIDDDNIVDKYMIENLVKVMEEHDELGEVGPINYVLGRKNKVLLSKSSRNMWTTKTYHKRDLRNLKGPYWETDDIPNAFLVRADVLRKYKIRFRKFFGIMYEESDLAYRIKRVGLKIAFVRNAKIYHSVEEEDKDFINHYMTDSRRSFVFARNRIVFHEIYSTNIQNIFIKFFWAWFFMFIYVYKFIAYRGKDKFALSSRVSAAIDFIRGTINGLTISSSRLS